MSCCGGQIPPQILTGTEPDPRYWPPEVADPNLKQYVEDYRRQGIYPPRLSFNEKNIINMVGVFDRKGNQYGVTWTLGGRPMATKKDPQGLIYTFDNKTGKFKRHDGCFGVKYLV